MQRVESAQFTPGECVVCARGDGPLVDTGKETALGRVYVCRTCIVELSSIVGLTAEHARKHDNVLRSMAELQEKLDGEEAAHEELRRATVLTLKQGAVTRHGVIQLRRRL